MEVVEVGHDVIPNQGGALLVGRVISGHDAIQAYKALGVWELGKNKLENPQTVVMRRLQPDEAIGVDKRASSHHMAIFVSKRQGVVNLARLLQDNTDAVKVECQMHFEVVELFAAAIETDNGFT